MYVIIILCSLAVNYLFLTNEGSDMHPELMLEPFSANTEQNDYEVGFVPPWPTYKL